MGENCIVMTHPDMNLTAGTTLQNEKYVVQKLLHQSDFGVTYLTRHAYLEQLIALQTLNDSVRQRQDFFQIQQQFLTKVRSLAQQTIANARVLDCFEEGGMPFVVFELVPGQMPPQLSDWLTIAPQTAPPAGVNGTVAEPAIVGERVSVLPVAVSASTPTFSALSSADQTQPPAPAVPLQTNPLFLSQLPASTAMATEFVQRPLAAPTRSKGWLPLALLCMSMLGGLLGAGFGLSLRLAAPSQTADRPSSSDGNSSSLDNSALDDPSAKLTPRLFSREQSFPSEAEWPISETPQFYPSDPTPIEEPLYRVNPAIENYPQPNFQPLPETSLQTPTVLPETSPTLKTRVAPQPHTQLDRLDRIAPLPPVIATPEATTSSSPETFDIPAPPAPAEPDLPPLSPSLDLPASTAPSLPLPDAAPTAPVLPANEAPVIKQ